MLSCSRGISIAFATAHCSTCQEAMGFFEAPSPGDPLYLTNCGRPTRREAGAVTLIFVILKCPFIARSLACLGERYDFKSRTATREMVVQDGFIFSACSDLASQCHCLTSGHDVSWNLRPEYENGGPVKNGRTRLLGLRRTFHGNLPAQTSTTTISSRCLTRSACRDPNAQSGDLEYLRRGKGSAQDVGDAARKKKIEG